MLGEGAITRVARDGSKRGLRTSKPSREQLIDHRTPAPSYGWVIAAASGQRDCSSGVASA